MVNHQTSIILIVCLFTLLVTLVIISRQRRQIEELKEEKTNNYIESVKWSREYNRLLSIVYQQFKPYVPYDFEIKLSWQEYEENVLVKKEQ